MMQFDPYLNWLGIPLHEQPPNFYRLLGVILFESNPNVVEQAADRQSLLVGAYQTGPYADLCQRLLSEIGMARFNLLDPQQKAGYDAYLQESLAQRGERAVSAPPPPATFGGPGQSAPQQFAPSQFGPPGSAPAMNGGMPMPTHMHGQMPGPMPPVFTPAPMQATGFAPMPQAAMGQRPMMQGAIPQPMPAPMPQAAMRGGRPAMPTAMPAAAPAAIPVAAPFPVAAQAARGNGHGAAAATMAPPVAPPSPPRRAMDEIESLASQPTTRRRFAKKKQKTDYSKEIMIGGIVAGFAVFLLLVFLAVRNQDPGPTGFNAIESDNSNASKALTSAKAAADKLAADKLAAEKSVKAKQAEKEKKKLADASLHEAKTSPLRRPDTTKTDTMKPATVKDTVKDTAKPAKTQPAASSGDGDIIYPPDKPNAESQDAAPQAAPAPAPQNPAPQNHDTPQDLGTDNDPVFDVKPDSK